jgi:hypothetical protein
MSHRWMRIATLAMVAGGTIALSVPTFAQPPLNHDYWNTTRWRGAATCTVTGSSPSNSDYTYQETHRWEVNPSTLWSWYIFQYYWANWTVTGHGSNADFSWTTNGYSQDILQFSVPEGGNQLTVVNLYDNPPSQDIAGITVRSKANGTYSTAAVSELTFPTIVTKPNVINSVKDNSSTTINKAILFKEPSDAINTVTCAWDFEYQPILLKPLPGTLCLPSMPDCGKPFVLKPPLKREDQSK